MLITTNGIILRERPVGENDKYAEVLSEDLGVIEVSVKGARKITSKNAAGTQLLTYSRLCVNKTGGRYILNSSQPLNTFYNIRLDVKKLALAAYLSDILRFTTPPEEPAGEVLRLFLNTLYYLDNSSRDTEQLKIVFELRIMCELGLMPELIGCCECFRTTDNMYLNIYEGKLVCGDCINENEFGKCLPLDKTMLHTVRYICLSEFEKIFSFRISEECQKKLSPVSERYLTVQLSKVFSTLEYYKNI